METADVVVIGGGIVGVSTAFFLAEAGVRDVLVLERSTVGAGASGRAAGMMLLQGDSEPRLRFQLESIRLHRRFRDELGTDLQEHGSLLLWCSAESAARARALGPVHEGLGISLEFLSAEELRTRFPYLTSDDVVLGTFSGSDLWATPLATVQRIAEAARARGVRIREHCEVTDVDTAGGRAHAVLAGGAAVHTPVIVNAAGGWARHVGEMIGVPLPIAPRKRQVFVLDPAGTLAPGTPFIMEGEKDFYCKVRSEGLIMVQGETEGETYETAVEWGYLDDALGSTLHRMPALRQAPITGAWAGIRPISADGVPFLGPAPGLDGCYVAGGFGGQGFTQGPLAGRLIAELITAGQASMDVSPYRVDRHAFARGEHRSPSGSAPDGSPS